MRLATNETGEVKPKQGQIVSGGKKGVREILVSVKNDSRADVARSSATTSNLRRTTDAASKMDYLT